MKAQLENSQEEVTTGAQGVTRGQKGPKKAKKAKKAQKGLVDTILLIKKG